jgi:hypothetical protein
VPQLSVDVPKPPVVLQDGSMLCRTHPDRLAEYQCTRCHEVLCAACVRSLRRQGGQAILLCPLCSSKVQQISSAPLKKKKRNALVSMFRRTLKLPEN